MKKVFYLMLVLLLAGQVNVSAQVTIGANDDPHEGAVLDLRSTSLGLLLPNVPLDDVADFQVDGDETDGIGMMVYNTNADIEDGDGAGVYVWSGTEWIKAEGGGEGGTTPVFGVTAEITDNYTVQATDGFISLNITAAGKYLTLPTSDIPVGKIVYVSNIGNYGMGLSPLPRNGSFTTVQAGTSGALIYLGNGVWDWVAGY